jgi:Uma2 family endonuclease
MMSVAAPPRLMTAEEFLALPDDGVRRWLIRGQLREERPGPGEKPMTVRNRWHSRIMVRVGKFIDNWLDQQPEPRGSVLCGEVGVRLRPDPETIVGVDVIYISAELAAHEPEDRSLVDGVPTLAVEILSPSTTQEQINEKLETYQGFGVPLVWLIDPHDRTVLIYQVGEEPRLVNVQQELTAEPHLPGFRVAVAQIFA